MVKAVLVGAGQRGAQVYSEYAIAHPDEFRVVAVAEPDGERREAFARRHHLGEGSVFTDWHDLFAKGKIADCAMVCTQDRFHTEPVKEALRLGYHVMCEKPMSPDARECIEMGEFAQRYGRTLTICHVLRYSPFYTELKKVVDSKVIGDIVSIQHIECVGYWHQAHSFVRGNWRNSTESSPMILQKSCHDMDILAWLIGKECVSVSSYGSLKHFRREEMPEGAGHRCLTDCGIEDTCPYSARKIYLNDEEFYSDTIRKVVALEGTTEAVAEALKTGPYGRCVYRCDNDVVDYQTVTMQFANGVQGTLTMTAFSHDGYRTIQIRGTNGTVMGNFEKNALYLNIYGKKPQKIRLPKTLGGHGGGDTGLIRAFAEGYSKTDINQSIHSHVMAYAAESSRLNGGTPVDVQQFLKEILSEN